MDTSGINMPELHVTEGTPSADDVARSLAFWRPFLGHRRRILDVGCGEGYGIEALCREGFQAEGVDATEDLVKRCTARGLKATHARAEEFVAQNAKRFDAITMFDFVEHVPIEVTTGILAAMEPGTLCIIQTPNTNSIIGHQFYLQVPGHIVPYSPTVLGRLFERFGIRTVADGTLYGGLPWTGFRRRATQFLLVKILGTVTTNLLLEGANYYVVGIKEAPANVNQ